jgi:SAM-dependent methyltransferase
MSDALVSQLYDRLCRFESDRERSSAYPVHKRLFFEDGEASDIYDWILQAVELGDGANVLDAGCGVGFGTLKLAAAGNVNVTGISVSGHELERAREYAGKTAAAGNVVFRQCSFDALGDDRYELIVAVESLKHSPDIGSTLQHLTARLADGGELVVVDDIFSGAEEGSAVECLENAWHLTELHRLEHYTAVLGDLQQYDLTSAMRRRRPFWNRCRFGALGVLAAVLPGEPGRIAGIFRGGAALDRLYDRGQMRYLALRYQKRTGPSS